MGNISLCKNVKRREQDIVMNLTAVMGAAKGITTVYGFYNCFLQIKCWK